MQMGSPATIMGLDPFSTDSSAEIHHLGEFVDLSDGRRFRYALAGASNISAGKAQAAPTQKTNHFTCTAIVSTVGTLTPTFTLGATAAVAGEYNEGWVAINVTPDVGRTYKVSNMAAVGSAGIANPTLFEGIQTAWTTATRVSLVHNTYNATVEGTVQTKRPAGTTMVAVTAANYYWSQVYGVGTVLTDTTLALGALATLSASVSGAMAVMSTTFSTAYITPLVAQATIMAGVDTNYTPVQLLIN